jgi:hypothetical protein
VPARDAIEPRLDRSAEGRAKATVEARGEVLDDMMLFPKYHSLSSTYEFALNRIDDLKLSKLELLLQACEQV